MSGEIAPSPEKTSTMPIPIDIQRALSIWRSTIDPGSQRSIYNKRYDLDSSFGSYESGVRGADRSASRSDRQRPRQQNRDRNIYFQF